MVVVAFNSNWCHTAFSIGVPVKVPVGESVGNPVGLLVGDPVGAGVSGLTTHMPCPAFAQMLLVQKHPPDLFPSIMKQLSLACQSCMCVRPFAAGPG